MSDRGFRSSDEARAYAQGEECRERFEKAQPSMTTLRIAVSPGDAEMVASWAEEGLKGRENGVAWAAVRRFREAFNDAARAAPSAPRQPAVPDTRKESS